MTEPFSLTSTTISWKDEGFVILLHFRFPDAVLNPRGNLNLMQADLGSKAEPIIDKESVAPSIITTRCRFKTLSILC